MNLNLKQLLCVLGLSLLACCCSAGCDWDVFVDIAPGMPPVAVPPYSGGGYYYDGYYDDCRYDCGGEFEIEIGFWG